MARLLGEEVSCKELVDTVTEVVNTAERGYRDTTPPSTWSIWRREGARPARTRQAKEEWAGLVTQVSAEMEAGTDPPTEQVQALAKRWMGLVNKVTGGNPGIESPLGNSWQQKETIHGIDTSQKRDMMAYISRAKAAPNEGRGS